MSDDTAGPKAQLAASLAVAQANLVLGFSWKKPNGWHALRDVFEGILGNDPVDFVKALLTSFAILGAEKLRIMDVKVLLYDASTTLDPLIKHRTDKEVRKILDAHDKISLNV